MSNIKIGWAETNITPDKKVSLAGQFAERISEYVEKPLTATALAVECGGDQMVLVSADLVGVPFAIVEKIRARLADNTVGLDPMKVTISATHTHCGPRLPGGNQAAKYAGKMIGPKTTLQALLPEGRKYVEKVSTSAPDIITAAEFEELFLDRVTPMILNAWNSRSAGGFSNAFGRAAVGHCRRAAYSDGSAMMWGETNTATFQALEGGSDTGVELLYFFDAQNALTGVVINLACPAQCVQHRLFVSPDFWGEVKMRLRAHFGENLFMLPLCSAAGDQCPVDLIRWVEPESDVNDPNISHKNPIRHKADPSMFDLAGLRKAGKRIANEVIDVYDEEGCQEIVRETVLEHRINTVRLPLRRVTKTEYAEAQLQIRRYLEEHPGDVNYNDSAMLQVYLGALTRFRLQEVMHMFDTEIHTIRFGNIAFASNPFELFLDYGNQIRARSKAEQTFLMQLTNGVEGYLPTEKAERGGHYSAFVSSGQTGHVGGELLVRETLDSINAMF